MMLSDQILDAAQELADGADALQFPPPVAYTYNPLRYAWAGYEAYVSRYGATPKRVLYLGMNPGPFGMAQTGVPFGEIAAVTLWMGIHATVGQPAHMHPKRPVQGFNCPRSEVSGRRLWGLFQDMYGTADAFFSHSFVANYCPLIWMSESGANLTPDKLPREQQNRLDILCRRHLVKLITLLQPQVLVGVGTYALKQLQTAAEALPQSNLRLGVILHPSPASPHANKLWPQRPKEQLAELLADLSL